MYVHLPTFNYKVCVFYSCIMYTRAISDYDLFLNMHLLISHGTFIGTDDTAFRQGDYIFTPSISSTSSSPPTSCIN